VAGEPAPDKDAEAYLETLRSQFSLPLYYEQVTA
jgi:hypothetical protein